MIEMTLPPLPDLQPAVDALFARINAGRSRATGTAVTSGLRGRTSSASMEAYEIIQAAMSGRHGERMLAIWSREDLHVAGASEDDWALACELSYQALTRGYVGEQLHQLVEEAMRAGPYRAKWDERRGAGSWLAQDVANAIATVQKRLGDRPGQPFRHEDEEVAEAPAVAETLEERLGRLERELGEARGIIAVQQVNLSGEREKRQALTETVRRVTDVMAIPTDQLNPSAKLVTLATIIEAHSRDGRGVTTLPISALMTRTGLTKNTVSTYVQDLAARDGSPITRTVTRDWEERADGSKRWVTVSLVAPRCETVNESLAAVLAMGGPSDKAAQQAAARRARESERERRGTPFGLCSQGDNDMVAVTGKCPDHGEIVGETFVRREAFEALNPNLWDSAQQTAPTVFVRTYAPNRRDSGPLNHTARDSAAQPSWLQEWPDDPSPGPPVRYYDDVPFLAVSGGSE